LLPLSSLYAQNSKDDEECAADEHNVPDRFERGEESLDDKFEAGSAVDDSERAEGADKAEHAKDAEDLKQRERERKRELKREREGGDKC
jgi:hypothetical protein